MGLFFCGYLFVAVFLIGGEWGKNCKEINPDFPIKSMRYVFRLLNRRYNEETATHLLLKLMVISQ